MAKFKISAYIFVEMKTAAAAEVMFSNREFSKRIARISHIIDGVGDFLITGLHSSGSKKC
jgi:hypothetical protein